MFEADAGLWVIRSLPPLPQSLMMNLLSYFFRLYIILKQYLTIALETLGTEYDPTDECRGLG